MTGIGRLATAAIMCDEPRTLAEFYAQALGWQIRAAEDDYAWITTGDDSMGLVFGKSRDYQRPNWPRDELPFHIDLYVDDLAHAEKALLAHGEPSSASLGVADRAISSTYRGGER